MSIIYLVQFSHSKRKLTDVSLAVKRQEDSEHWASRLTKVSGILLSVVLPKYDYLNQAPALLFESLLDQTQLFSEIRFIINRELFPIKYPTHTHTHTLNSILHIGCSIFINVYNIFIYASVLLEFLQLATSTCMMLLLTNNF